MIWSPKEYDEASVLAREAGEDMLSRLDWMTIKPNVIVDMGCGTGAMSARLHMRYQGARVLALDLSDAMLHYAKHNNPSEFICADAAQLPLSDGTVDLIFANFLLPWYPNFSLLLNAWRRVLRPNGLLMMTALGPDTLQQCRQIFPAKELPSCIDMHEIGDELMKVGFADPVLDVSHYTMVYRDKEKLMAELRSSGMVASAMLNANAMAASEDGTWPITYEVIHAHAFVPEENTGASVSSDGTVRIPLTTLRRQLHST